MHLSDRPTSRSRRRFLAQAGTSALGIWLLSQQVRLQAQSIAVKKPTDPLYASVTALAKMVRDKEISAVELVTLYYRRIDEVNPKLNALVLDCRERALKEAAAADAMLARGELMGPLHGVPMTVKDSHDAEGLVSTGGTLGRKNFVPTTDATSVGRCRKAGAIVLGKTNTPEFTLSYQTTNLIHGRTENPYKLGYQPGGSTGGGAALIAAGGTAFDLGTDFGGSIRVPAHNCGIAGHKPSAGLVPRTGHIVGYGGVFDAFQVIGPMSRWVEDMELILGVISGPDFLDAAIIPMPLQPVADVKVSGLKVAWYVNNGSADGPTAETTAAVHRARNILSGAGLTLIEDCPEALIKEAQELRNAMSAADGREWVRRLYKRNGTSQAAPNIGLGDASDTVDTERFTEIVELLDLNRSKFLQWFNQYDLILAPVNNEPATEWPEGLEAVTWGRGNYGHTPVYNTTGWPGTTVRVGTSPEGLPIGVQVLAHPFRDALALAAAAVIEAGTGGYQAPVI